MDQNPQYFQTRIQDIYKDLQGALTRTDIDERWNEKMEDELNELIQELKAAFSENTKLQSFTNVKIRGSVLSTISAQTEFLVSQIRKLSTILNMNIESDILPKKPVDKTKVFVVHGHDKETKKIVSEFLSSLQLMPIILHQQANEGNTIIEKFEKYSDVSFAVVLLTPDDAGDSKNKISSDLMSLGLNYLAEDLKIVGMDMEKKISESEKKKMIKTMERNYQKKLCEYIEKLTPRSRQNVIFELGYFFSKLGRKNVVALIKDKVEKPSDMDGIVYVQFDKEKEWQQILIRELIAAGMSVYGK